jgi:hypothetical protein
MVLFLSNTHFLLSNREITQPYILIDLRPGEPFSRATASWCLPISSCSFLGMLDSDYCFCVSPCQSRSGSVTCLFDREWRRTGPIHCISNDILSLVRGMGSLRFVDPKPYTSCLFQSYPSTIRSAHRVRSMLSYDVDSNLRGCSKLGSATCSQ